MREERGGVVSGERDRVVCGERKKGRIVNGGRVRGRSLSRG